jgi:hypothetical protein
VSALLGLAISRNGVPIRLTAERWAHIVEAHDYMAGLYECVLEAIADPDAIAVGWEGTLIATQRRAETPLGKKDVVVVYREVGADDGFVITAFMTSKGDKVWKRGLVWRRSP